MEPPLQHPTQLGGATTTTTRSTSTADFTSIPDTATSKKVNKQLTKTIKKKLEAKRKRKRAKKRLARISMIRNTIKNCARCLSSNDNAMTFAVEDDASGKINDSLTAAMEGTSSALFDVEIRQDRASEKKKKTEGVDAADERREDSKGRNRRVVDVLRATRLVAAALFAEDEDNFIDIFMRDRQFDSKGIALVSRAVTTLNNSYKKITHDSYNGCLDAIRKSCGDRCGSSPFHEPSEYINYGDCEPFPSSITDYSLCRGVVFPPGAVAAPPSPSPSSSSECRPLVMADTEPEHHQEPESTEQHQDPEPMEQHQDPEPKASSTTPSPYPFGSLLNLSTTNHHHYRNTPLSSSHRPNHHSSSLLAPTKSLTSSTVPVPFPSFPCHMPPPPAVLRLPGHASTNPNPSCTAPATDKAVHILPDNTSTVSINTTTITTCNNRVETNEEIAARIKNEMLESETVILRNFEPVRGFTKKYWMYNVPESEDTRFFHNATDAGTDEVEQSINRYVENVAIYTSLVNNDATGTTDTAANSSNHLLSRNCSLTGGGSLAPSSSSTSLLSPSPLEGGGRGGGGGNITSAIVDGNGGNGTTPIDINSRGIPQRCTALIARHRLNLQKRLLFYDSSDREML